MGYGKPYRDILNVDIDLTDHSGVRDEWYRPTILPGIFSPFVVIGDEQISRALPFGLGFDQSNSSIEADSNLLRNYGTGVGLINPFNLTSTRTLGSTSAAIKKAIDFSLQTVHSYSPGSGFLDIAPNGEITATTGSPIFAFISLEVSETAQYFEIEFHPLSWETEDLFAIFIQDQLVFRQHGAEFVDSWMLTGEIDLLPWLGDTVELTLGYFSEEAGNSIVYRSAAITELQPVPLPAPIWLLFSSFCALGFARHAKRKV